MLTAVVIVQLGFLAGSLAGTGLRFSKDPTAFAVFRRWNAKTNGTLKFHFRTHSENGLLLYQDDRGQCQFIYLSLADGRLRMRLKMGNCEYTQTLLVGHKLADGKWHKVTVQRNYSTTKLTLDGEIENITQYIGSGRYLGVESDLRVGGVPWYTPFNDFSFPAIVYESTNFNRFVGCISGIMYNNGRGPLREAVLMNTSGTDPDCLDPCSQSDHCMNGGICRDTVSEVWCDCKGTGYEGPNCTEESASVWLNGTGYIVFHMDQAEEKSHSNLSYVAFGLRTIKTQNGIILSLQSRSVSDFLLIEMVNGKMRVEIDLGQGGFVLQSGVHVNDGQWYLVEFRRSGRSVILNIDGRISDDGHLTGKSFQLNVADSEPKLYLGGGPRNVFGKSQSKLNLTGQIRELYFRNIKILDYVVPVVADKRFEIFGTVIDGSEIPETSGSGCDPFSDDEELDCVEFKTNERPTDEIISSSSTSEPTSAPGPDPADTQSHRSLPKVVPFWIISVLVVASVIAIVLTIFFLYRWNSRYSGSFKPEPSSSSTELPKLNSKPRIYVSAHEEKA